MCSDKGQKNSAIEIEGLGGHELVSQNTPPDSELFGRSEQNAEIDRVSEGTLKGEKAKSGDVITHSRTKLFKNPTSFSYIRLLPYLMDLTKNNPNALGVNQCGTVDNSVEEMPPPSLLVSQDGLIDSVNKDNGHSFNDSDASPTGTSNEECSNMVSPEHPSRESPTQKPSTVSTVNGSMPTNLPLHLDGESVSQISQDTSNPAHDARFVQTSSLTEGSELDNKVEFSVESCQGDQKNNGSTVVEGSCGGVSLKPEQGMVLLADD